MSQLITINTKKDGIFDNYFEDTIKIPPRSEVAFIKTLGCNIKYSSYEYISTGFIDPDDYDKNIYRFCCDGVNVALSPRNIYDGYVKLSEPGQAVPIEDFWIPEFRWTLDATKSSNVCGAIAAALNERFIFYHFDPAPLISFKIGNSDLPIIQRFGLRSNYSNNDRLDPSTIDDYLENIQNLAVYKGSATLEEDKITSTADDTCVYSQTNLAINGGFVTFNVPNDKKSIVGISFTSIINGMQDNTVTGSSNPELDFAIHTNANGDGTYNILRRDPYSNQIKEVPGVHTYSRGVGVDSNNFTFLFSRTAEPEATQGSTEYTCFLLQGWNSDDGAMDYEEYIVARQKMQGGYMPTFIAAKMENGAVIDAIQAIHEDVQDIESRVFVSKTDEPNDNDVGRCGTTFRNTHTLILKNSPDVKATSRDTAERFAQELGFQMLNDDSQTRINDVSTTLGNELPTPLLIQTRPPTDIEYKQFYYLPSDPPPTLDLYDAGDRKTFPEPLPYLQFHIESLDLVSYEGNYQKRLDSRQQNTATKVLQNIPRGEDRRINSPQDFKVPELYTVYDYEVFNPIYIALNNPSEIQFNQLQARLTTPNNQIVSLDLIDNSQDAKVMLHIRKELATDN